MYNINKTKVKSWLTWLATQASMVALLVLDVKGVGGAENVLKLLITVNFILWLVAFVAVPVIGDEVVRSLKGRWHIPITINYVYGLAFACALAWFGHLVLGGLDLTATIIQSALLGGDYGERMDD